MSNFPNVALINVNLKTRFLDQFLWQLKASLQKTEKLGEFNRTTSAAGMIHGRALGTRTKATVAAATGIPRLRTRSTRVALLVLVEAQIATQLLSRLVWQEAVPEVEDACIHAVQRARREFLTVKEK